MAGLTHESVGAMREGVQRGGGTQCRQRASRALLGDGTRLLSGGNTDIEQRDSGCLAVPSCETELGLGQTTAGGAYANQRLNPRHPGKAQGRNMVKTSNRTRETRPYGIIGGHPQT